MIESNPKFKPKKSLGQNFLISDKIAQEIVDAGEVGPDDVVLEAGPGKGVLTEKLLKRAKKVIAVEKDEELAEFLKEKFAKEVRSGNLWIIGGDILDPQIFSQQFTLFKEFSKDKIFKYKLIANIPYYITSRFLRTFLENPSFGIQPSLMVLMVQKEVAERIVGKKDGAKQNFSRFTLPRGAAEPAASQNFVSLRPLASKESLLSISVKVYGSPEIIMTVSKGNFRPVPKVDSAVIKISGISKKYFADMDEKAFFGLVKKGFSQKRKILINNLNLSQDEFNGCGIPLKARAEDLGLEQWKCLIDRIKN